VEAFLTKVVDIRYSGCMGVSYEHVSSDKFSTTPCHFDLSHEHPNLDVSSDVHQRTNRKARYQEHSASLFYRRAPCVQI
jgi:hypothetical protein